MRDHESSHSEDTALQRVAQSLVADAPSAPEWSTLLLHLDRPERTIGRRLVPAVAAATVVLVGMAGALLLGAVGDERSTVDGAGTTSAPQRFRLDWWRPQELLPDGSVVDVPVGRIDRRGLSGLPQLLPGGGTVALGLRDVSPESGEDSQPMVLTMVDPDGSVEFERELSSGDRSVWLLAATRSAAILGYDEAGGMRIVLHDLETGRERNAAETDLDTFHADLSDGQLVVAARSTESLTSPGCRLEMIDLDGGDRTSYELPSECWEVWGVHASPDGNLAAVVYGVQDPELPELRVAVIDLVTSGLRSDDLIGHNLLCSQSQCPGVQPVKYLGLAWDDDVTFRIALSDLAVSPDPPNPEGHRIPPNTLVIDTHTVQ